MKEHIQNILFTKVAEAAQEMKVQAFVIGGYVRDIFLKRPSDDIDITVVGSGIELAKKVAIKIGNNTDVTVFKNFGTAMLRYKKLQSEFVGARKESYQRNSRKPIVEDGTLEDDQNRRDFTINTLAISLCKNNYGELIDSINGLEDIKKGIIRTPLEPNITFSDDPLRMMRAIRFATQLNFRINDLTFSAIIRNKERIQIVSKERIADEINKIILSIKPSLGFKQLQNSGLLEIIFPEFSKLKGTEYIEGKGHKDNFNHTLEVLDKVAQKSDYLWLRWAAILHDIAKPNTKKFEPIVGWTFHAHEYIGSKMVAKIFRSFKLPLNDKMLYVQKLVMLHLRPIVLSESYVTDSAVRRLLFEAGDDIDDLMILCDADITSKNTRKIKEYMKNFQIVRQKLVEIEEKDHIRNWQPPITGEIIMQAFNLNPGKDVGTIKNAIREAILDGKIKNEYDDAYHFMIKEGKKLGLFPTN